jgi:glycine/D-amino acid oxidase-like deaminating enzyme
MNLSYWEKSSFINYDIIIIGGGLVGLSTAISIKEKAKQKRVLVLDRGIFPSGASTKNAGFACVGSLTEILDDLATLPETKAIELVNMRKNGLTKLRQRLGDSNIGYEQNGSYELIGEKELEAINEIKHINNLLYASLKSNAFELADEKIEAFKFDKNYCRHLIRNTCEGEINTGKMMRSLIDCCLVHGIEIKTGVDVSCFEEKKDGVHVKLNNHDIKLVAQQLVICNNAFAKKLLPKVDVTPGRGQVLITKPIPNLSFKGIFHFDKGYFYFREIEGRILFGGGRNLDFEGETTTEFGANAKIQEKLIHILKTVVAPHHVVEVDYWWSGIMAFGTNKFPIVERISSHVYAGVRMGGMGVAIGSETAEQLANLVLTDNK